MTKTTASSLRTELEQMTVPFEMVRRQMSRVNGWLRTVRQMDGTAVKDAAVRAGVLKREILRLEIAEKRGQMTLARLRQLAAWMDYDVVYAFVPQEATLEDLARREIAAKKRIREERVREREGKRTAERFRRRYGDVSVRTMLALEVKRELKRRGMTLEELAGKVG